MEITEDMLLTVLRIMYEAEHEGRILLDDEGNPIQLSEEGRKIILDNVFEGF